MSQPVRNLNDFATPMNKSEQHVSIGELGHYREIDVHENGKAKGSTMADCREMTRMEREQELKVSFPPPLVFRLDSRQQTDDGAA